MRSGCCARAASGEETAAPPTTVMNSRRLMWLPQPRTAPYHIVEREMRLRVTAKSDAHVRFGSKADVTLLNFDVRFTPESGHPVAHLGCPLWANSGHCDIHSISASARCCMPKGTSRPSDFAVLRLMIRSNLVGACTGRSAGLAPLRMRSTYTAAWGNCSAKSLA